MRTEIDIDKNLELFYEREENKEDTYIGAISKHECVVDGWFVIELLEEVKRLRELADNLYDFAKWMQDEKRKDPIGLQVLKDRMYWRDEE